jgi:hypothetical protein
MRFAFMLLYIYVGGPFAEFFADALFGCRGLRSFGRVWFGVGAGAAFCYAFADPCGRGIGQLAG